MRAPISLRPALAAYVICAMVLLCFATLGIVYLCSSNANALVGFLMVVASLGGTIPVLLPCVPGWAELTLNDEGFEFCWGSVSGRYAWQDVEYFSAVSMGREVLVGIRLRPTHPLGSKAPTFGHCHDRLDGYSLGVMRLVALLEEYRTAAEGEARRVAATTAVDQAPPA